MNPFETLVINLLGDISHYTKALEDAVKHSRSADRRMSSSSTDAMRTMQNAVNRYAAALATTITLTTAVGAVTKSIGLAAHWESVTTSFTSIIGDAQIANDTLLKLRKFADWSPFSTVEVLDASRIMLAMGTSADKLVSQMMVVGEVASALGQDFKQLAIIHGRNLVQGRMYLYDINQYLNHAIPVWEGLGKIFNIDEKSVEGKATLRQMVEDGLITAQHIDQIFRDMAKHGGRFYKGMENASKDLKGLFETMKSEIENALREIGFELIKNLDLKYIVKQISELSQKFGNAFKTLDPWTQKFIIFTTVAFTGLVALTIALRALQAMLIYATFGMSKIFLLAGLITVGLASWATEFGSIKEVLETIKGYVELINYAIVTPEALKNFKNDLTELSEKVKSFTEENSELINKLSILGGIILSVVIAYKLLILTYTILYAIMTSKLVVMTLHIIKWMVLKAVLVATTIGLIAYKSVLLLVMAVQAAYNIITLSSVGVTLLFKAAMWMWAAAAAIATIKTWLLNIALTYLQSVFSIVTITAFTAALLAVTIVFGLLASAVYGVYKALDSVLNLLVDIPNNAGPIMHIRAMFMDWLSIINNITRALKHDTALAWQFVSAGFRLMVAQIKDQWQVLWPFLKDGFRITTQLAADQFESAFKLAVVEILDFFAEKLNVIIRTFNKLLPKGGEIGEVKLFADERNTFKKAIELNETVAKNRMKQLIQQYKVEESLETKMAKKALEDLEHILMTYDRMAFTEAIGIGIADLFVIADAGNQIADAFKKATGEIKKFDHALVDSAEGLFRIQEYKEMLGRQDKWIPQAPMPHEWVNPRIAPFPHEFVDPRIAPLPRMIEGFSNIAPMPHMFDIDRALRLPPGWAPKPGTPHLEKLVPRDPNGPIPDTIENFPIGMDTDRQRTLRLLERIANATEAGSKKPSVTIKEANL